MADFDEQFIVYTISRQDIADKLGRNVAMRFTDENMKLIAEYANYQFKHGGRFDLLETIEKHFRGRYNFYAEGDSVYVFKEIFQMRYEGDKMYDTRIPVGVEGTVIKNNIENGRGSVTIDFDGYGEINVTAIGQHVEHLVDAKAVLIS